MRGRSGRSSRPVTPAEAYEIPRMWPVDDDARDTWNESPAVSTDPPVMAWLRLHALDPVKVAGRDLCRVLRPSDFVLAARACRHDFEPDIDRLLLPLHLPDGKMWSLHAERILPRRSPLPEGVERSPINCGLILANLRARGLLSAKVPPRAKKSVEMVLVEDVLDYLAYATRETGLGEVPAVVGVAPGSWTVELEHRLSVAAHVALVPSRDVVASDMHRIAASLKKQGCELKVLRDRGMGSLGG